MGYGLFVPEFREAFGISTSAVGFVASLGFAGFFVGLLAAQPLLARRGPRLPVVCGLAAATVGMGVVALAPSLPVLAAGVFLAASSAGLSWTPFNDAVHRTVPDPERPAALSAISSGTGVGIALAGLAALAMALSGLSWRACWALFAAAGALALLGNAGGLRGMGKAPGGGPGHGWRDLRDAAAIPLLAIGFAYGTTSAIFIAFAADRIISAGGPPGVPTAITPALVYVCYGLVGLAGLFTGRAEALVGLPRLLRLLMLAGATSLALVAITPGSWAGLTLSAGLQGLHVMLTSAVLAFWSERLFPILPSRAFTAAILASATGSVLGPAAAGLLAEAWGARAMFLAAAALPALTALLLRDRHVRDHAARARPEA